MDALEEMALGAYDRTIGLELADVSVDGCITKAPCGGEKAGRSPVDRGKGGIKRSTIVDANGIPLGVVTAGANRHDSPLLAPTLEAAREASIELPEHASVHLDRAYDSKVTRWLLQRQGLVSVISEKGKPAPLTAGLRHTPWPAVLRSWGPHDRPCRHLSSSRGDCHRLHRLCSDRGRHSRLLGSRSSSNW
jgi:hypothetical protein